MQWQEVQQCNGKPCTNVQPVKAKTKSTSCKTLPRKVPDIQDFDKPSELVATGLHIEAQVGRDSHKILMSKITPVHTWNSKSGLGVC